MDSYLPPRNDFNFIFEVLMILNMAHEDNLQVGDRTCKDCGAVLGAGREDRQYCDDGCRTNFNNRKRRDMQKAQSQPLPELETQKTEVPALTLTVPEYITRIQEILLKNREIMESLCNEDRSRRMRFRDFLGKGFNAKYFTMATGGMMMEWSLLFAGSGRCFKCQNTRCPAIGSR
jgi:hypothetical protein